MRKDDRHGGDEAQQTNTEEDEGALLASRECVRPKHEDH